MSPNMCNFDLYLFFYRYFCDQASVINSRPNSTSDDDHYELTVSSRPSFFNNETIAFYRFWKLFTCNENQGSVDVGDGCLIVLSPTPLLLIILIENISNSPEIVSVRVSSRPLIINEQWSLVDFQIKSFSNNTTMIFGQFKNSNPWVRLLWEPAK